MMANANLCQRIVCGATSQDEAGLAALYECSEAGYVGVLPCSHPSCQPYASELQSKGVCATPTIGQQVVEMLPLHPATQPYPGEAPSAPVPTVLLPADLVAPLPSIVNHPAPSNPEALEGMVSPWQGRYCQLMTWVSNNPGMVAVVLVAGWMVVRKDRGR